MSTIARRTLGVATLVAYIATIVAANWAVARFGAVPVAPHLLAPAGVYLAGLAFTLRDIGHKLLGPWAVLAAIGTGALVAAWVSTAALAIASAAAFGLSELADMAVYTPLEHRGRWLTAVTLSNTVGLVVDSALFLWLAFGSLHYLPGQIVGKAWITAATVALLAAGRTVARRKVAAA